MPTLPRPRVLVVDDDPALLSSLQFALEAEGFRVRCCASPEEALADGDDLHCLVVDYKLPDMDGATLIERLRGMGVRAPVILMTTNPDARCRARAAKIGAVIVEKPLLGDKLLHRIQALISPGA